MKTIISTLLIFLYFSKMNAQTPRIVGGVTNVDEAEEKEILNKLRDGLKLLGEEDRLE